MTKELDSSTKMKILLAPLLLAVSLPAFAEVDSKIHKLCVEAKDYSGCVRSMKGETMPTSRVINSQGADIAEGNKCPSGFAYIGGGNCQAVKCSVYHNSLFAKHDSRLGGKSWGCSNFLWKRSVLYFGEATARASIDSNCPSGEPEIGWNSTCEKPPSDSNWAIQSIKAAEADRKMKQEPNCDFKLKAYSCSYEKYLDNNPTMKQWAELNPEMAEKERLRLQSVD